MKLINKKSDCKIQLTMQFIFISTKNLNDKRILCIKIKNVQASDDINELFDLLKKMHKDILSF